jgi:hypothetical protein
MYKIGDVFINGDESARICNQSKWLNLYNGTYIYRKEVDPKTVISMEQLVPVPQTISAINSTLLFGEFPEFDFQDDANNKLIESKLPNTFQSEITSNAEAVSAVGSMWMYWYKSGDDVKRKWYSPSQILYKEDDDGINDVIHFALNSELTLKSNAKKVYDITEWILTNNEMSIEETPGKLHILHYSVTVDASGKITDIKINNPEEITEYDFMPWQRIDNIADFVNGYGRSDYKGLEQLFGDIDNRIDQINSVLDEHADPWIGFPQGFLRNGIYDRSQGKLFEKSGTGTDSDISISQWDARLDSAFEAIDKLIEMVLFSSRISPALAGYVKGGVAESGRALKWRSIATFSMLNSKRRYWEDFFYNFFEMWKKFDEELESVDVEMLLIKWQDGLPLDTSEVVSDTNTAVQGGFMSKLTAIENTQELDPVEAQKELDQINVEAQKSAETSAASNAIVL